jgi:hypothetical protein
MPYINWKALPWAVRASVCAHEILAKTTCGNCWPGSARTLLYRKAVKDFGSFKPVGKGKIPLTILASGQAATGERVE